MQYQFACATDVGRVRPNNEDAVLVDADLGLAVLADGMGGYNAGEVASRLCCEVVHATLRQHPHTVGTDPGQALAQAIERANTAVYLDALSHPAHRGMATTVVAAWVRGDRLAVGHVGDSRLYRLRQGQFAPLTRDHTLVQEHIDAGLIRAQDARATDYRNLVTRGIGIAPRVDADIALHTVAAGDTYLLCSDGLTDMLTEPEIAHLLCRCGRGADAAQALIAAANAAGGRDNLTVALIHCAPDGAAGSAPCPR